MNNPIDPPISPEKLSSQKLERQLVVNKFKESLTEQPRNVVGDLLCYFLVAQLLHENVQTQEILSKTTNKTIKLIFHLTY